MENVKKTGNFRISYNCLNHVCQRSVQKLRYRDLLCLRHQHLQHISFQQNFERSTIRESSTCQKNFGSYISKK
jgi:hypothetical protein